MGPTRTSSHSAKPKSSNPRVKDASPALPGVQKIKSSLRQTRRLLAKDTLAADVRIETERRLKSLEADLAKAERGRKERNFAVKYHKVKFFERQKVCRRIKHTKKLLDAPDTPPESLASLRETLLSHRVDLNYILHYPKTQKYISLFPLKSPSTSSADDETDRQREGLRRWINAAMKKGEMDTEPEDRMDKTDIPNESMDQAKEELGMNLHRKGKHKHAEQSKGKGVAGDAFFEVEGDSQGSDEG